MELFLRPERIDKTTYVGLPDSKERAQLFALRLEERPVSQQLVDHGARLSELAQQTQGYSGADIAEMCERAARQRFLKAVRGKGVEKEELAKPHQAPPSPIRT